MESYTIIDNDIWKDHNIKGYEKLVLIYLVRNFNVNYGYSFPTREQIQEATGIGNNALNRALNSLEEKGYITRSKREGKAGRNNIYYINKYLVGQQDSSQASTKPKPNNKSRNKKKQATEVNTSLTDDEDLYYKLGFIENSVNFTGDFTEQQASLLDNYSMEQIEKVFNSLEDGEEIGPWTFLNMLRKTKGVS
jgi:DNA-binding transcriptional regulator YhcF (GntR family)